MEIGKLLWMYVAVLIPVLILWKLPIFYLAKKWQFLPKFLTKYIIGGLLFDSGPNECGKLIIGVNH